MRMKQRVKTPTVLQMEAVECGAASLAMILAYFGRWIPLEKLRGDCGVNRDGSTAQGIVKAARKHGCEAKGYRWKADKVLQKEFPLIIHWEFNHFVVLEGIKDDRVYLNDPGMGHRTVSVADFHKSYTGIALKFTPRADFVKNNDKFSIVKEVTKKLFQEKLAMVFTMLISLFLIVPGLAVPVFSQVFLDDVLTGSHVDWLNNLMLAMGIACFLLGILHCLKVWVLTKWQVKWTLSDSSRFFWHVLRLPVSFFQQRFGGEVASRVEFNASIAEVLSGEAATSILDFFVALFYLLLLFHYNVSLTLIGLLFTSISIFLFFWLRSKIVEMTMKVQQDAGKVYGTVMNGIQIIETLKANGNEGDFFAKWAGYRVKVLTGMQHITLYNQTISLIPMLLAGVNSALIMTVGGFSIMDGVMTAGMFMAFQALMGNFQQPVNSLLSLGSTLQTTEMQMQRLNDVLCYKQDGLNYPVEDIKPIGYNRLHGKVELRHVEFGFTPLQPPLIEDFCCTIEPGRQVAFVGFSGSGKSTVAKIVSGLYEEWGGQVLFDDINRKAIPHEVITNSLAVVDQDIVMFSGTVEDNLSLFDSSIRRSDIVSAAKDACIHDDILKLDKNYEAEVAEGGANFSGGQRQRLEIARALAVNPSILILDEATSALDPVTEQKVMENIRRRGISCIIIAHRLSTIRDCDEIIVLDEGRIIQRGRHVDMIARKGSYQRLLADKPDETLQGAENNE